MKHLLIVLLIPLSILATHAQVRFVEVDHSTNEFAIKNFGGSTVDISNYRLCALLIYTPNLTSLTVVSGSLNLTPGGTVVLKGFSLSTQSDFGLYLPGSSIIDFGLTNFMVDFVQWGSGGNGREAVAVSKGIWGAGDFISNAQPQQYIGNGTQNGVNFWQSVITGVRDVFILNEVDIEIYPNPFKDYAIFAFNFPFENKQHDFSLVFYDMQGKEIRRIENIVTNKTKITRGNLPDGMYILELRSEKELFATRKILVKS